MRPKDQSCHHETWLHRHFVDWNLMSSGVIASLAHALRILVPSSLVFPLCHVHHDSHQHIVPSQKKKQARCVRRIKNGTLAHRPRVGEKSGSLRSKKRSRGCVRKLSCSASSQERRRVLRRWANRREEGVAWKKAVRWNLTRRQILRKNWRSKWKSLQRQLRDVEKFASMDPFFRDRQKEVWKEELEEIERKRTELLPENQKVQKRSQKSQSLRDKQMNHFKNACACEEEMQMLHREMEERKALRHALPSLVGEVRRQSEGSRVGK